MQMPADHEADARGPDQFQNRLSRGGRRATGRNDLFTRVIDEQRLVQEQCDLFIRRCRELLIEPIPLLDFLRQAGAEKLRIGSN